MAINPLSSATQFNFALEALRQSVRQDQVAAAAITQAQQAPDKVGLESEPQGNSASSGGPARGTLVDILA